MIYECRSGRKRPFRHYKNFLRGDFMGYMLTCDDGEFYFDDIDQAIEFGEHNCPRGYNIDEVHD